jgi:hypothetical protein
MEPQKPEFAPDSCPRCSEKNTPGMKFCGSCGAPLSRAELAKSSIETQEMYLTDAKERPNASIQAAAF